MPMFPPMDSIRVVVVGDGAVVDSLAHILPRRARVAVLGPVERGEAASLLASGEADLAIVDLDQVGGEGIRSIELLRGAREDARVLGSTSEESPDQLVGALVAGACGVVPRRLPVEELLRVLHRAVRGEIVIPDRDLHQVVGRIHRSLPDVTDERRLASLTSRETQILLALTEGLGTGEIAKRFGIRVMTVQSHVKAILAKLGVHSKVEAVTFAWRAGVPAREASSG